MTARFGVDSMTAPLRRVAMMKPGAAMLDADPEVWHYAEPLDAGRLEEQYDAFATLVSQSGAEVEWIEESVGGLADSVFAFDPSCMTPDGAILLRPGKALRQGEVPLHESLYERLHIPVIGRIEPPGTAEGGDLLWVDPATIAVGRGFRTNQSGIDQLRSMLEPQGISVEAFDMPVWNGAAACLHLLSLISPLDQDLAVAYPRLLPVALLQLLEDCGVRCLEVPETEFTASGGLNLNVLATAPRTCIAIDGFPITAGLIRGAGCELVVFTADSLCLPCEGGPTCLTLPLLRG